MELMTRTEKWNITYKHALGETAFEVEPHRSALVTLDPDAAARGLGGHAGDALHFFLQQRFDAVGAGKEERRH